MPRYTAPGNSRIPTRPSAPYHHLHTVLPGNRTRRPSAAEVVVRSPLAAGAVCMAAVHTPPAAGGGHIRFGERVHSRCELAPPSLRPGGDRRAWRLRATHTPELRSHPFPAYP